MNGFDDRELRDALRRRAGAATDGFGLEAARSAVVAQAGRVRRRRAAVAGGAAMAGLIAAAVLVIGPGSDSVVTTPADSTDGSAPASVDATTPDQTTPDQTTPDQNIAPTPTTNTTPGAATTVPAVVPPTATAPSTTAPPTETTVSAPPTAPQPTPSTSVTAPGSTVPTGPAPFTETYTSTGGSITVRWDGTALHLEGTVPAAGFDPDVEDELADRIRVRFRGDDGDFRIEIRFEDGEIVRVE